MKNKMLRNGMSLVAWVTMVTLAVLILLQLLR